MTAKANRSRHGLWKLPVLWKTANGRGFPQGPWTPANGAGAHSYHRPQLRRIPNESGQFTCQTRPDRSLVFNTVLQRALDEYVGNVRRGSSWSRLVVKYFGDQALSVLGRSAPRP